MAINLLKIKPNRLNGKVVFREDIISWFENENALWRYQGEPGPEKPHAELSSGLCSNGFIDCQRVLCYPNIAEILGFQTAWEVQVFMRDANIDKIDYVVAPPYAGMTFGHEVAKALGARFVFTEKDPSDPKGKKMLWQRMAMPEGSRVLQVDELITTTSTIKEVREAIEKANPEPVIFVPFVATLVYRPESLKIEPEIEIISLIRQEIQNFEQSNCPYCAAGSPRVRPKKNWAMLTGKK
jgi:orotate phosphoribosyltransferase